MIKLIVSDIDGTLVPDGSHEMNPELLDVIMKIREKRGTVCGCQRASGRQHRIYVFTHKEGDFLCGGEWLLSGMLRKKSFSLSH